MTAIELTCRWCAGPIPITARMDSSYCGVNHRMQAYRARLRTKAATLARYDRPTPAAPVPQLRKMPQLTAPTMPDPEPLDPIDAWFASPIRLPDR